MEGTSLSGAGESTGTMDAAAAATQTRSAWTGFREQTSACDARLLGELRAATGAVRAIAAEQQARLSDLRDRDPVRALGDLARVYDERVGPLLVEPLDAFRRQAPQQRVLAALDEYDRSIEQLVRRMPETLQAPGSEWIALLGRASFSIPGLVRTRVRRELAVGPATTLLLGARAHRAARRRFDGRLLASLAEVALDLITPWQVLRRVAVAPSRTDSPPDVELARFRQRCDRQTERATAALLGIERWLPRLPAEMARRLHTSRSRTAARLAALTGRDDRHREFLGRQVRAVDADLDLETQLARTERSLVRAAEEAHASIEQEHQELLDELNQVVAWLDAWSPGNRAPFPPSTAEIVSSTARVRAFARATRAVLPAVPHAVEVTARLVARPGVRATLTTQTPRDTLGESLDSSALPTVDEGLQVLERQHQGIIIEIERAREVVAFARETARSGDSVDQRIEVEGIGNARSLLQFHRQHLHGIPPDVESAFVTGLTRAFTNAHVALDEGQFGVLRQAARDGLPRTARVVLRRAAARTRVAVDRLLDLAARGYRMGLVSIGWIPAPLTTGTHVVARGYLTRTLGSEARLERLPMIYQRLFRLVPVEDPRFLIGREQELAAVSEARTLWEQGRDASVLFVGERGSGKTSLINCAAQRVLTGLDMVRSEFVDRLTTRDEMHDFLGELLGVPADALEAELMSKRRLIVLEELERTFLRTMNGYDAIRSLLHLISRTSRQTFWILSINLSGFRLLDASLRMAPHFSHQINAMAVEQPHLREAIMMRHTLSGLRLRFAPPLEGDSYARRFLDAAGVEADPEGEFFDALYRQSGGVFRSAFALWQRYIDRAEGGVLYMKRPTKPEYEEVIGSLDTLDLFTLAALMQHGSLTPREHSVVFQIDEPRSRAWIDNLLARELVEPDPGRYGFRVVPDASQIVRETLFRRNLG